MIQDAWSWCTGMTQRDGRGREVGGEFRMGTHVHPWWIHVNVWQNNTFESVLMRWMKLEPIIQSEVNQKEKHQYSILTHIYGI